MSCEMVIQKMVFKLVAISLRSFHLSGKVLLDPNGNPESLGVKASDSCSRRPSDLAKGLTQ